ncbi:conserved hypothetical protein [Desulforamulus reducens MI-1]|uniref:SiaC family regulatory phosphoprotein domain-containing protein n=1 Tax=Desulforamulus reducens (strain ATCC BAA-1160 / DSM 100696 / MI-1) TaxID=349161 RepID=A4J5L5_DESRM|nr:DUF1987 domain-containing protein [Desulforamulus reducens]ABO50368.1 conserved hypothetical protein [Desulforamulus reducens MI-1]
MDKLFIEGSKSTPEVYFDPQQNILLLQGQSYPENAFKFYEPIFNWVDNYLIQLNTEVVVKVDFILPYINTSSSKCIMMLLEKLDKAYLAGKQLSLNWYYNQDNESELECAEEFKEDLNLPFYIIPREDN